MLNRTESSQDKSLTRKLLQGLLAFSLAFSLSLLPGCSAQTVGTHPHASPKTTVEKTQPTPKANAEDQRLVTDQEETETFSLASIPAYTNSPYVEINEGVPSFTDDERRRSSFEEYAPLDELGRCGVAFALIGPETMPTKERGPIGQVRPSGWHLVKYDCVDGKYLFNRCHLIGYQLAGENANTRNLITGTRYLNVTGMLPFENNIADYVKASGNHVLFRVTPVFEGEELVARGLHMEAFSIEDDGQGIAFNVYCYNAQPGIGIDYATGENWLIEASSAPEDTNTIAPAQTPPTVGETNTAVPPEKQHDYMLNTNTKKLHYPYCSSVSDMSEKNKQAYSGTRSALIDQGYTPCKRCNP